LLTLHLPALFADRRIIACSPLTTALLRLHPMFDPLRNDPRFQKLIAEPAVK
jgi:hypothetical protein